MDKEIVVNRKAVFLFKTYAKLVMDIVESKEDVSMNQHFDIFGSRAKWGSNAGNRKI